MADKIAAAQQQIAELMTFTSELQQAAFALERHRPEGACDPECGCVGDPSAQATAAKAQPVVLSTTAPVPGEPTIACTLSAGSMKGRLADWKSLLEHVERREPLDSGTRCVFAASVPNDELLTTLF